jgi:hypothetical protein
MIYFKYEDFENSENPNMENQKSIQEWENIAKYKCGSSDSILNRGKEIQTHKIKPKLVA